MSTLIVVDLLTFGSVIYYRLAKVNEIIAFINKRPISI